MACLFRERACIKYRGRRDCSKSFQPVLPCISHLTNRMARILSIQQPLSKPSTSTRSVAFLYKANLFFPFCVPRREKTLEKLSEQKRRCSSNHKFTKIMRITISRINQTPKMCSAVEDLSQVRSLITKFDLSLKEGRISLFPLDQAMYRILLLTSARSLKNSSPKATTRLPLLRSSHSKSRNLVSVLKSLSLNRERSRSRSTNSQTRFPLIFDIPHSSANHP